MSFQSGSPLVTHLILPSPLEVGRSKPQRREVKCLAQAGWGRGRGACPWSVLGDVNPYNSGTILLGGDVFAEGLRSILRPRVLNKEMRSDVSFREMTFAHLITINLELLQGRIQEQWQ